MGRQPDDAAAISAPVEDQKAAPPSTQQQRPQKRLEGKELLSALQKQVESYFSRQNLSADHFLVSKMNAQMYVPVSVILQLKRVKDLTVDAGVLIKAVGSSKVCTVDETGSMIKPNFKAVRNTIILREIPTGTTNTEVKSIFEGLGDVKEVRSDVGDTWFVSMADESTAKDALLKLRLSGKKFKGQKIKARLKSENLLRSFYPTPASRAGGMAVPGIAGTGNAPSGDTAAGSGRLPMQAYQRGGAPPYYIPPGTSMSSFMQRQAMFAAYSGYGPMPHPHVLGPGGYSNQQRHRNGGRQGQGGRRGGPRGPSAFGGRGRIGGGGRGGRAGGGRGTGKGTHDMSRPTQSRRNNSAGKGPMGQSKFNRHDEQRGGARLNHRAPTGAPQTAGRQGHGPAGGQPQRQMHSQSGPGRGGGKHPPASAKATGRGGLGGRGMGGPVGRGRGKKATPPDMNTMHFPPLPLTGIGGPGGLEASAPSMGGYGPATFTKYTPDDVLSIVRKMRRDDISLPASMAAQKDRCGAVLEEPLTDYLNRQRTMSMDEVNQAISQGKAIRVDRADSMDYQTMMLGEKQGEAIRTSRKKAAKAEKAAVKAASTQQPQPAKRGYADALKKHSAKTATVTTATTRRTVKQSKAAAGKAVAAVEGVETMAKSVTAKAKSVKVASKAVTKRPKPTAKQAPAVVPAKASTDAVSRSKPRSRRGWEKTDDLKKAKVAALALKRQRDAEKAAAEAEEQRKQAAVSEATEKTVTTSEAEELSVEAAPTTEATCAKVEEEVQSSNCGDTVGTAKPKAKSAWGSKKSFVDIVKAPKPAGSSAASNQTAEDVTASPIDKAAEETKPAASWRKVE